MSLDAYDLTPAEAARLLPVDDDAGQSGLATCAVCAWVGSAGAFVAEETADGSWTTCADTGACLARLADMDRPLRVELDDWQSDPELPW